MDGDPIGMGANGTDQLADESKRALALVKLRFKPSWTDGRTAAIPSSGPKLAKRSARKAIRPTASNLQLGPLFAAWDPLDVPVWILCARQNEQQIRQAIKVAQSEPVDVERLGSEPSTPFCAPSYCAGIVKESPARRSAREDKAVQLREICIELVAMLLQAVDLLLVYPKG